MQNGSVASLANRARTQQARKQRLWAPAVQDWPETQPRLRYDPPETRNLRKGRKERGGSGARVSCHRLLRFARSIAPHQSSPSWLLQA